MRLVVILAVLAACEFPRPSEEYACQVTADCATGRTCVRGYCVVGSGANGPDSSVDTAPNDAAIDGTVSPDADTFPQVVQQCIAAGYDQASNGGYYRLPSNSTNWVNAEADCANDVVGATHLVVLSTAVEVQIAATEPGWVGLSDRITEGTFVNVTNEPNDQRPWASGQPDDGSGNEDCARILSNGQLDDDQCSNSRFYVCECDGRAPTP